LPSALARLREQRVEFGIGHRIRRKRR
jgi:hypothetical protein